jgi:hypothetical protein
MRSVVILLLLAGLFVLAVGQQGKLVKTQPPPPVTKPAPR